MGNKKKRKRIKRECPICKEKMRKFDTVITKVYKRKDGSKGRVDICLNKGCGYKKELPDV